MWMVWTAVACVCGALGVALGAFGAHGLQGRLSAQDMQVFETAVRYQMYHVSGFLAVALASSHLDHVGVRVAGDLMLFGVALFSGSRYGWVAGAPRWLGVVTPFGGVALISGWLVLAASLLFLFQARS